MLEVASINSGFIKKSGHGKYVVCLAHNDDGLSFEKREELHAAVPGTNVVIDDMIDDFTILKDDAETNPQHRYKMLSSRGNWWAGLTPATSTDGIRPSVEPDAVWTRIALNERLTLVLRCQLRPSMVLARMRINPWPPDVPLRKSTSSIVSHQSSSRRKPAQINVAPMASDWGLKRRAWSCLSICGRVRKRISGARSL